MAVHDANEGVAQGLLFVAYLQQQAELASGDQMKKLIEFVSNFPNPDAVDSDFVGNLLAVSRSYMRGVARDGETVPEGITEWRQRAFDRFERELPVQHWRLLAKSDELPSMSALKKAKKKGGAEYDDLAEQVRAIACSFSDWKFIKMINVSDYASDLPNSNLVKKYFEDDKEIAPFRKKLLEALELVGKAPWNEPRIMDRIFARSDAIIARLEAKALEARDKAGAKPYAQGYDGDVAQSRTGGHTPSSVAVRLGS
jgi:hypothetical protein